VPVERGAELIRVRKELRCYGAGPAELAPIAAGAPDPLQTEHSVSLEGDCVGATVVGERVMVVAIVIAVVVVMMMIVIVLAVI
jgi:hypothetical protein